MRCIFALADGAASAAIVSASPNTIISRRERWLFIIPPVIRVFMPQTLGGRPRRVVRASYVRSVKLVTLRGRTEKEGPGRLLRQSLPGPMYAADTWCPWPRGDTSDYVRSLLVLPESTANRFRGVVKPKSLIPRLTF